MRIRNSLLQCLAIPCAMAMLSIVPFQEGPSTATIVEAQLIEFNTDGLYYAEFFDYIFRGHFEHLEVSREDLEFLMLLEQYLRAFGKQCPSYLPDDKVEIMDLVCATEEVTTDGYGIETSRVCIEWVRVGSGLYARPDLYQAKGILERSQSQNVLGTAIDMMTAPNAVGNSVDRIHKAKGLSNDLSVLFTLNACNSAGIKRFEDNLNAFARNEPGIRMQEPSKYAAVKKSGGPSGAQDFRRLIDDLVANQAKTWGFNRYVAGSISGISVQATDAQGRPSDLKADYKYQGFGATSNGWVRITFVNGLPECIYFFDFPGTCKTPGSSIVASYAQGAYRK